MKHGTNGMTGPAATLQDWRKIKLIFPSRSEDVWDQNPSCPHVLEVGGKLRMYYEGRQAHLMPDGGQEFLLRIGMAEASLDDPCHWIKNPANPTFGLGPPGSIDSHWAGLPWIVRITDTHWHLYYVGWGGQYHSQVTFRKRWCTTLAESDDAGLTWRRSGQPLLPAGRPGSCGEHGTGSCSVIKVGDEYWMWYTAVYQPRSDYGRISIALAISRDEGHTFEPHPAGAVIAIPPILNAPGSTSSKPYVVFHEGKFRIWFSYAKDGLYYRIHYAESLDGVCFRWHPEPVLDVSPTGWDSQMTCYPSILHLPGRTLMFYVGNNYTSIGLAELK